jgi:hypothetical protein
MRRALVTVATDGSRDYVVLPDGQRRILGTISVLKFVTELTPHIRLARQILDQYLKHGEALLTVDLDRMDEMFTPKRARWSSDSSSMDFSLIGGSDRTSQPTGTHNMADTKTLQDLLSKVRQIETVVASLDKFASESLIAPKHHAELRALVGQVVSTEETASAPVATPSVDTLQANSTLAEDILATVEQTDAKVEALVTAGRKFNASRAKEDLYGIASKVAEILNTVDMAQPWVGDNLQALTKQAKGIHDLFAAAKV